MGFIFIRELFFKCPSHTTCKVSNTDFFSCGDTETPSIHRSFSRDGLPDPTVATRHISVATILLNNFFDCGRKNIGLPNRKSRACFLQNKPIGLTYRKSRANKFSQMPQCDQCRTLRVCVLFCRNESTTHFRQAERATTATPRPLDAMPVIFGIHC